MKTGRSRHSVRAQRSPPRAIRCPSRGSGSPANGAGDDGTDRELGFGAVSRYDAQGRGARGPFGWNIPRAFVLQGTDDGGDFKDFIARHVFHPLQGMTLGDWWALLRRHRFAIDLRHWPRALVQTAVSASNSVAARIERRRFGRRIEAARVQAPLFILGHYRSGTTHLHNLLALDPQFAAPTFFQVLNPHTFLTTERWAAPVADRLVVRRRYQDEMALGAGVPSEDEFALVHDDRPVALHGLVLPRGRGRLRPLPDVPGRPGRGGRPLEARPDHVPQEAHAEARPPAGPQVAPAHRPHPAAPGAVPRRPVRPHPPGPLRRLPLDEAPDPGGRSPSSTSGTARRQDGDDRILSVYTEMYDAYFEERGLIPEGRLCEVGYEDLERDPVGVVGSIYEALGPAGVRGPPAPAGGLPRLDRRLSQEPPRRTPRAVTPSHRPRVGPELRRVGIRDGSVTTRDATIGPREQSGRGGIRVSMDTSTSSRT